MVRTSGNVLIADGDARARAVTARALRRAGYATVEVSRGSDALDSIRANGVALLLLEVTLPDMTGWEVCREVRDLRGEGLPILFLSDTKRSADRIAGLLLGADDFIVKPFEQAEFMARVRRFVRRPPAPRRPGSAPVLTAREDEILGVLAAGKRPKEIAREFSISPKTVATHIQNLLVKFEVHSRAELIARAYLLGLAVPPTAALTE